jgi:hypothetical protein
MTHQLLRANLLWVFALSLTWIAHPLLGQDSQTKSYDLKPIVASLYSNYRTPIDRRLRAANEPFGGYAPMKPSRRLNRSSVVS